MDDLIHMLAMNARDYWGAWLMLMFLIVIGYAYFPGNKASMNEHAMIPLQDDHLSDGEE